MAQAKLWTGHPIFQALMMGILAMLLVSCRTAESTVGMTLVFQSAGRSVVVQRFDPDGRRGPVPGVVSPGGAAHMTFMPGDSKRGIPTYVDVAWVVPTDEFYRWTKEESERPKGGISKGKYDQMEADFQKRWAANPSHAQRLDLTAILTPELVAQVSADRQNTQLKLTITFNNSEVDIKASAYKWR